MDESVVMVSGVLKEARIDYAQGNTPFLVWDIGVDISGTDDVENGEQEYSHKSRHRHPVLHHIGDERDEKENCPCMLQELLMRIDRVDEGDSRESRENQEEYEFAIIRRFLGRSH